MTYELGTVELLQMTSTTSKEAINIKTTKQSLLHGCQKDMHTTPRANGQTDCSCSLTQVKIPHCLARLHLPQLNGNDNSGVQDELQNARP